MSLKYVHQLCFWEKILGGQLFLKKNIQIVYLLIHYTQQKNVHKMFLENTFSQKMIM